MNTIKYVATISLGFLVDIYHTWNICQNLKHAYWHVSNCLLYFGKYKGEQRNKNIFFVQILR